MGGYVGHQTEAGPCALHMKVRCAFSLIEMLVVVGIISVLIAMLMPTVQTARESAKRTQCASNLRQLGYAIQSYANDNRGWIPRDATLGHDDRPPWPLLLGRYLAPGRPLTIDDLPEKLIYQCPSHVMMDIPTGYVINAFAFDTQPDWKPDGPIQIALIRNPSQLPWMFDCANNFPLRELSLPDKIYGVEFHDVYDPRHLPRGPRERISDDRHGTTANVLYLDTHVSVIHKYELKLEMLDDHVIRRATTMPLTEILPP